ncbi:MAG: TetR/AcrR family transcriptional regulator [Pseudolabrys sp.]
MVYRRTPNVTRRMAEREQAILGAARTIAGNGGMAAVQIVPVSQRAGIAAGTVYRYFPSKSDLVTDLVTSVAEREIAAMRSAGDAAPGPLSALAATIATFAARIIAERRLSWAVIAEPTESGVESARLDFRNALVEEIAGRIRAATQHGHLTDVDAAIAAPAIVGALLEGLVGPQAPSADSDGAKMREAVQSMTLFVLRGLGVVDARARGLVAQVRLPPIGVRR